MSRKPVFFKLLFPKVNPNSPLPPEVEIHSRHDATYERMIPKITEAEFEGYIDHLIRELENIRREGQQKFARAKTKFKS